MNIVNATPHALCEQARAHAEQGQLDVAAVCFQQAIALDPAMNDARFGLGAVLQSLGQWEAAAKAYKALLMFAPKDARVYANLAKVFKALGDVDAAAQATSRSVELALLNIVRLSPELAAGHSNLGVFYSRNGLFDAAVKHLQQAVALDPSSVHANENLLFAMAYGGTVSPQSYLTEARQYAHRVLTDAQRHDANTRAFVRAPRAGRRLRVAYLSGDFRAHAVSYFMEALLGAHDRSRVELWAYASADPQSDDAVTARLRVNFDHWTGTFGMPDDALLLQILSDEIDVLIDLSGHTGLNRLPVLARRAAPVQCHYLGYFASTGLSQMDYWLGDAVLTPASGDADFSETVWRLPRPWVTYQANVSAPAVDWTAPPDGRTVLGSFNHLAKMDAHTLALWARVLVAMPNASLVLKAQGITEPANRERIRRVFAAHGVAAERVELVGQTEHWAAHMALYNRLDIALDPVGAMGGGTTTCDALWMGVPVVSLSGTRMARRMSASMLHAVGHPEWVCADESAYIDTIKTLAQDRTLRAHLRPLQREKMRRSPLCDAKDLARHLEASFEAMFDTWWDKQSPSPTAA